MTGTEGYTFLARQVYLIKSKTAQQGARREVKNEILHCSA
jgi:hypothetical protein